jgi:oligopeptide/dipeptide ABC transporter ATP-binding protein
MEAHQALLEVKDLQTYFFSREGTLRAVDGVSFAVQPGEVLGIIGESGCGKSVTAQSILRIVPANGKIVGGQILFRRDGNVTDLARLDPKGKEIRSIRGKEISMVFQEPMTSFHPVYTIGNQIMEVIRLHQGCSKTEARERAVEILARVEMPNPEQQIDAYPFNLSGGMRQRAMIAMALACKPKLLIADEPTSAVDVTIQAQILQHLIRLQKELGMSVMMITHDLGVVAETADSLMIMYLGENVEYGPIEAVFEDPKHPYTKGLLASVPKLGKRAKQELNPIKGFVPSLYDRPEGCPFHPRCPSSMAGVCDKGVPPLTEVGTSRQVRCFLYGR